MKTQIYYMKLVDGKELVETSRSKIYNALKDYIVDNNKSDDRWYYPSKAQIDNIFYNKVKKPNLYFIQSFMWCNGEDLYKANVKTQRENGKRYTEKYIKNLRNKMIKNEIERLKVNPSIIDTSRFNTINVC